MQWKHLIPVTQEALSGSNADRLHWIRNLKREGRMIKWGVTALSCISWSLKLSKPQAQLCNLLCRSGSLIKIKSTSFFFAPRLSFWSWENQLLLECVEETWGSWAPRAAAAAAAAVQCFKGLLLDIRVGGDSKENRSYSLLEPAVAFHNDDSSIFLSPCFATFSWCGKDSGGDGGRRGAMGEGFLR